MSSLYQGLLGRSADPVGLSFWEGQMLAGTTRAEVALEIQRSDEFLSRAVQIYYQDFLGRTADVAGLNFWVDIVRRGGTLEEVKANILGSDEFFAHSGGNVGAYLNGVYQAELGRAIDPVGLAYWSSVTPNDPVGRAVTASMIMRSAEGMQVEIASIYQATLGRPPDPTGAAHWFAVLEQGESDSKIIAQFLGSNEYFAEIQQVAATATDPDAAAHQFIVSANRFGGFLPGAEQLNSTIMTDPSLLATPPVLPQPTLPFFPGQGTTGPTFPTGPVVTVGPAPTGPVITLGPAPTTTVGPIGGGSSCGCGGGSGGASPSYRSAAPDEKGANGGMRGVGGRGQGGGLYAVRGLLSLPNGTASGRRTEIVSGTSSGNNTVTYSGMQASKLTGPGHTPVRAVPFKMDVALGTT